MKKFFISIVVCSTVILISGCVNSPDIKSNEISINKNKDLQNKEIKELIKSNNTQKAISLLNQITAANPMDAKMHFLLGLAYEIDFLNGNFSSLQLAEAGYIVASQLDSNFYEANLQLGRLYIKLKKYRDAQHFLMKALSLKEDDATIAYELSYASYYAFDIENATKSILYAYGLDPLNINIQKSATFITNALGLEKLQINDESLNQSPRIEYWKSVCQMIFEGEEENKIIEKKEEKIEADTKGPLSSHWADCAQTKITSSQFSDEESEDEEDEDEDSSSNILANKALPSPCKGKPLPRMTTIDATIIQIDEEEENDYGINLLDGLGVMFDWSTSNERTDTDGTISRLKSQKSSISLPSGGIYYSLNIANASDFRNHILATPSLIALDREPARFFSGSNLLVSVSGQLAGGDLIEKSIGIGLSVTPTFINDDTLLLSIQISRSGFASDAPGSFKESLHTLKTSVQTSVLIGMNQTLVLSGLVEKDITAASAGVPGLKSTPVLNTFFNEKINDKSKKSLLIVLTPRYTDMTGKASFTFKPMNLTSVAHLFNDIKLSSEDYRVMNKLSGNKYSFLYKAHDLQPYFKNDNEYIKNLYSYLP